MQTAKSVSAVLWPVLIRTVLPSALGAAGTMTAVLWSDGFRAFCGVSA